MRTTFTVAFTELYGGYMMDEIAAREEAAGENCLGEDELSPHPALNFALCYLSLADILAVERVCKSLHSTVQSDPLLWRSVHLDQPLNERIADDVLLNLPIDLRCLRLVECTRITDDGLKCVLEANPTLIKLSVPGCTRLTIDGIVGILKAFRSMDTQGVMHLHIGVLYDYKTIKYCSCWELIARCCSTLTNHIIVVGEIYIYHVMIVEL
ncbi:hypothetical protein Lal_00000768 [Lupinus albus]|nr:hypothetical protein Lal_00000768 [Lupinus albus]